MLMMAIANHIYRRIETSPRNCRKRFRFNEANVNCLVNQFFGEEYYETRGGALTPMKNIELDQNTVSKAIMEITIKMLAKTYI